ALAYPGEPGRLVLLRRVIAQSCPARVKVVLRPRADYDRTAVRRWHCEDGVWSATAGPLRLRWSGAVAAQPSGPGTLAMQLDVAPGRHHDFVLEIADGRLADRPPSAETLWEATFDEWRRAVPALDSVR